MLSKYYLFIILLLPFSNMNKGRSGDEELTSFRKYILEEINFLRTRPSEYAEKRLKNDQKQSTDNGAYEFLKKVKPVKGLKFNDKLNEIALDYARFMSKKDKFSHDANGTPFSRAKKAGYQYRAMGENIACGNDPQLNALENPEYAAVEFLKMLVIDKGVRDVGHRHNLMNAVFSSVGIGFGHNPKSYCINYVVQDFGNP